MCGQYFALICKRASVFCFEMKGVEEEKLGLLRENEITNVRTVTFTRNANRSRINAYHGSFWL